MMVTFISQCEKNALKKTRRVLDAFANRIGDNTWQTVITEEGLLTVKKMLRRTASKSTAVSCHWIRSRSRSQFLWVVGNRRKFDGEGRVPVNITSKEVFMERLPIETSGFLANTRNQVLSKHLFSVGFVAYQILEALGISSEPLKQAAFIAGVFHDIGKIDPEFQKWINKKLGKIPDDFVPEDGVHIDTPAKFSFEKHPRHHEVSWVLAEAILDKDSLNEKQRSQIAHAIYWHHTKPFRKNDKFTQAEAIYAVFKKSLANSSFDDVYRKAIAVLGDVVVIAEKFGMSKFLPGLRDFFTLTTDPCPVYKKYVKWAEELNDFKENVNENSLNNLVRAAVISADRLVSDCSSNDLEEYLAEGSLTALVEGKMIYEKDALLSQISSCLRRFENEFPGSDRNLKQSKAADQLVEIARIESINERANIGVLQGPAGCGKTKIALEWALKTEAKKIIWICPRVQICLGLFHDLTSDSYLPSTEIEIFTGEYKKIFSSGMDFDEITETEESDYFSGQIIITTIDQIINSIRSHSHVETFVHFMNCHVVFDEFHELINMPAFNLLFAELIEAKKQQGAQANTLLVSATPHYFFLTQFLEVQQENIVSIDSNNCSDYQIDFVAYDEKEAVSPLIAETQEECTFVISNTAMDAQIGFLKHHRIENSVLLHSKYTKIDKARWFDEVFECFKQNGNRKYEVLRSGPIVQASLNISCDKMLTEITCAENWLQRLGRLDRFGENESINRYITVMPESIETTGKQHSSCARFLNRLFVWNSSKAWLFFLKDRLADQEKMNINQLYEIYRLFYEDKGAQECIKKDLILALLESVKVINKKVLDPISVPPKSKRQQGVLKLSANSLRGDNRFVQMAMCHFSDEGRWEIIDEYVCSEEGESSTPLSDITESVRCMRGYDNDDNNLVQEMRKNHPILKGTPESKPAKNEWELIKRARSPEEPIYLSYTPKDLKPIGGERAAHKQAIYYVKTDEQPVGSMSVSLLREFFTQANSA